MICGERVEDGKRRRMFVGDFKFNALFTVSFLMELIKNISI